jgi:hypothetical protein
VETPLAGVACPTSATCVGVGTNGSYTGGQGVVVPLAVGGGGVSVRAGTPVVAAVGMLGAACPSGTSCVGVGSAFPACPCGVVVPMSPAAITSAPPASFSVGQPGAFTVMTTGFPTPGLSEAGALPGGVSFGDDHDGTATLSGTPASGTAGSYPLTLTASNRFGPVSQCFTLAVSQASNLAYRVYLPVVASSSPSACGP